nr:hypothetical protein [Tanacetum cinerariifolium]
MFLIRIHHGGTFRRYLDITYFDGHVDIFDMVDIDLFNVVAHDGCSIRLYRAKLIQKLLLNQKCMGYLVRAYYSISPTRKISGKLSKLQDEDAQNKTNIQEPRKLWWWKFKRC